MDRTHEGVNAMITPRTMFTLSFASISSSVWAAAEIQQWPPIIIGVAGGVIAFLFGMKGAVDDRLRKAMVKQMDEMEIDYAKRESFWESRLDMAEKRTEEIRLAAVKKAEDIQRISEEKAAELKDKLDEADDERRMLRHSVRDLQNQISLMKAVSDKTKYLLPDPSDSGVDASASGVVLQPGVSSATGEKTS